MSLAQIVRQPTFRITFNGGIPTGTALEISNPVGSSVSLYLLKCTLNTDSGTVFTVTRRATPGAGGTSATITAAPSKSNAPASVMIAKAYTVSPTPGALIDTVLVFYSPGSIVVSDALGATAEAPIELQPGETLNVAASNTNMRGYMVWAEAAPGGI